MASDLGNISLDAIMGQMDSGAAPAAGEVPAVDEAGAETGDDSDVFDALSKFDPIKIADYFKMKGWLDADWKLPEGAAGEEPAGDAGFGDMEMPDESADAVDPMTNVTGVL